jgi:hypothetical protein
MVQSNGNQYSFLLGKSRIKTSGAYVRTEFLNSLNADLIPICHLLVLLGGHPIIHISRIRVNGLSRFSQLLQEATPQSKPPIISSKCLTHLSFHTKKPELVNASLQYKCNYQPHVALNS